MYISGFQSTVVYLSLSSANHLLKKQKMVTIYFLFALVYQLCVCKYVSAACGGPPELNNAHVVNGKKVYEPGEEVVYSCNPGYAGHGYNKLVCPKAGIWNRPKLHCEPRSCPVPKMLENGEMHATEFKLGKQVYYHCNEGFILRGKMNSTCQADGTWSDQQQFCEPVQCSPPTVPINGKVKFHPTHRPNNISVFGDVITYECMQGLALIGNETGFCQANGKWSNAPQCKEVKCPPPPKIVNGFMVFAFKNKYNFGESVEYGCIPNYVLDGPREVTCQKTARWTEIPSCQAPCTISIRGRIFYNGKKIWSENLPDKRILHRERVAFYCYDKQRKCGYPVLTQCIDSRLQIPSCYQEPSYLTYQVRAKSLPSEIKQC
ncbi:beta-2-glycoprotein 1-like [Pristis pectinata]|uniref:beta-2-glycoprotein 1-like n=1 Tax=Pristis pectinata TaxID=685728 RepID=UPI00223CC0D6|nr:beta-2-glycoprotein 1-like [Pristis pectinata]